MKSRHLIDLATAPRLLRGLLVCGMKHEGFHLMRVRQTPERQSGLLQAVYECPGTLENGMGLCHLPAIDAQAFEAQIIEKVMADIFTVRAVRPFESDLAVAAGLNLSGVDSPDVLVDRIRQSLSGSQVALAHQLLTHFIARIVLQNLGELTATLYYTFPPSTSVASDSVLVRT